MEQKKSNIVEEGSLETLLLFIYLLEPNSDMY